MLTAQQAPPAALQVFSKQSNGPLWFGLPVNNIMNSVVTLNVRADSLTLTTNTAPGAVISAVLCSFNNASCGGFTALNQHGYLHAVIQNTGYIDASYTVEVRRCLPPIPGCATDRPARWMHAPHVLHLVGHSASPTSSSSIACCCWHLNIPSCTSICSCAVSSAGEGIVATLLSMCR